MGYSGFGMFGGSGGLISIIPIIVNIGVVLVFGAVLVRAIQGVRRWKRNNDSPILTVDASIVSRRSNVSHHHHMGGSNDRMHDTTSTTYYVTFEVESGDRIELLVDGREYGLLAEGDRGRLTFQGTRYHRFERAKGGLS